MMKRSLQQLNEMQHRISFRNKIFIFILVSMGLQLAFIGINFRSALHDTLEHQVGTRALVQAQEIASDPALIKNVSIKDIPAVDAIIDRLHKISDASFIVVGDENGIRLSHPIKDRIGLPMKGGDSAAALEKGESYISISEGSLGVSVRGKTPILDADGNIIGVISVGYLLDRFDQWLISYATPLFADFFIILIITLVVGWLFSTIIKRKMNGMEPAEIALAFNMQKSILRSVYEGLIAIDKRGKILAVNDSARELIGTDAPIRELKKKSITEFIDKTQFFFHTPYDENLKDEIVSINGNTLIANRVAIFDHDLLTGWVISFRHKNDINSLTAELTQIEQHADNLRLLRDEYEGKLEKISTFITSGKSWKALSLINNKNFEKQQTRDFITAKVVCTQVSEMLVGKHTRARELGLNLRLEADSQLSNLNENIEPNELATTIGSLIDNAFEATLKNPDSNKTVSVLITDAGKELIIEVKDNGCGIEPELAATIFSRGVTSKEEDEGKGVGLYLINRYVTNAGGVILVDNNPPKGTVFSVFIPNNVELSQSS